MSSSGKKFIIEKLIGEGASGIVYSGTYTDTGEKVAIKFVKMIGQNTTVKFNNEIDVMRKVGHCPYVTKIIDVFKEVDQQGIAEPDHLKVDVGILIVKLYDGDLMKYNEQECTSVTKKGVAHIPVCDERMVLTVGFQIATALECVHASGYIHCDVKQENILVEKDFKGDTVFHLADFGLAYPTPEDGEIVEGWFGTTDYLQPESNLTSKKDIWALGVVLYELTYGYTPFDKFPQSALIGMMLRNKLPQIEYPDCVQRCSYLQIMKEMLERDPEKRLNAHQVAERMRDALEAMDREA